MDHMWAADITGQVLRTEYSLSKTSEETQTNFKLGGSILPYSNEDLGVIVDNHLTFTATITTS